MSKKWRFLIGVGLIGLAALAGLVFYGRSLWVPVYQDMTGSKQTVEGVLADYGGPARARLEPYFQAAGVAYPPPKIALLGIKDSATLELWAQTPAGWAFIRTYPIKALSGTAGPKRLEGDRQVPEGLYSIAGLNPNSAFHLSMKLNYPNAFDLQHAAAEQRHQPGSNIFIHGKAQSVGCLAMGDEAIEELFVLAATIGKTNIAVAIAPSDPRLKPLPNHAQPPWVAELYQHLTGYFRQFRRVAG